jgi:hypothetical protein
LSENLKERQLGKPSCRWDTVINTGEGGEGNLWNRFFYLSAGQNDKTLKKFRVGVAETSFPAE